MDRSAGLDWAPYKNILRTLYVEQNLSLTNVRREMATSYHFNATKAQYELQFKKWQFRKNRTAGEWKIVAQKIAKRKYEQKESEVLLDGESIHPKKLKKEILRYKSLLVATDVSLPGQSSPTLEHFVIRTPPPKFTTPISKSPQPVSVSTTSIVNPVLIDYFPFRQFDSDFSYAGNLLLSRLENGNFHSLVTSQNIYSNIISQLRDENIEALMPKDLFLDYTTTQDKAISHIQPSSVLQFLKLSLYLISNKSERWTVSRDVYKWIREHSSVSLIEYLLSIGGPTIEAFTESLFHFALEAEDVSMIQKMIQSGVDPNDQVCRASFGISCTPLQKACEIQSLKIVKALIEGGAKAGTSLEHEDTRSTLLAAVSRFDEFGHKRARIDPEIARALLDVGVSVSPNSSFRECGSALAEAASWGYVDLVERLVSAGADANIPTDPEIFFSAPLHEAVTCEDHISNADVISMVRILLNAGADIHAVTRFEMKNETAIAAAMPRNSIELIRLLLANGARVTEASLDGAVKYCDKNIVKLLLNCGGIVTESVIKSAVNHNTALVDLLLEAAGDMAESYKICALITSIACSKMDLFNELIASGTKIRRCSDLEYAIQEIVRTGNMDVLTLLLDPASDYRPIVLESLGDALQVAIANDHQDIADVLLAAGAEVNSTGHRPQHKSPLLAAIRKKDPKLVRKLLSLGASVNGEEVTGGYAESDTQMTVITSVLPAVVDWGYYPLIEDVINAGAEIDAPEKIFGRTALFIAVKKKDKEVIELLLGAGAHLNASEATFTGQTALTAASQNNDLSMVRYLLELGADPNEWALVAAISGSTELVQTLLAARLLRYKRYSRAYGYFAMQEAIRLDDFRMIQLLLVNGINPNVVINEKFGEDKSFDDLHGGCKVYGRFITPGVSALGLAIMSYGSETLSIIRLLLNHSADANSIVIDLPFAYKTMTALLAAIDERSLDIVKVLIEAGADANPSIRRGVTRTPLQLAAEKGEIDIVNVLLDKGAHVNMPPFDRYGATALQFAAIHGFVGIAQLLLQRGADVNASSAKIGGRTALEGAAENGRIDMLQLLLNAGARITGPFVRQYNRARDLALENGHRAACRLLEKYKSDVEANLDVPQNSDMGKSLSAGEILDFTESVDTDENLNVGETFNMWEGWMDRGAFEGSISWEE